MLKEGLSEDLVRVMKSPWQRTEYGQGAAGTALRRGATKTLLCIREQVCIVLVRVPKGIV